MEETHIPQASSFSGKEIKMLPFLEAIRTRPVMYIGSTVVGIYMYGSNA